MAHFPAFQHQTANLTNSSFTVIFQPRHSHHSPSAIVPITPAREETVGIGSSCFKVASAPALVRLHSWGGERNLVVAMEPQPKVQKLDHHDVKVVQVASQALRVKKLAPEAILPSRGSALAAGYDLSSAYDTKVPARGKALVKTELSIAIPEGTYARVAPRSGLAWKNSIDVGAGVIDADYRGPVGVILFNHSDSDFPIKAGDRIAQLILELIVTPDVMEVEDLDATVRGEGGFGSTGVSLVVET